MWRSPNIKFSYAGGERCSNLKERKTERPGINMGTRSEKVSRIEPQDRLFVTETHESKDERVDQIVDWKEQALTTYSETF